jgi:hypothetical protein
VNLETLLRELQKPVRVIEAVASKRAKAPGATDKARELADRWARNLSHLTRELARLQPRPSTLVALNDQGRRVGETHPRAKLTNHDIDLMFELREQHGLSVAEIAAKFEISRRHAGRILSSQSRNHTVSNWRRVRP